MINFNHVWYVVHWNQEDCKTQLTLELTHEKSCRILDTLVLEALRGVNIKEIEKNLPKTSDVFLSDDVKTACSVLADGIIVGLYEYLAPMKASAVSLTLLVFAPTPFPLICLVCVWKCRNFMKMDESKCLFYAFYSFNFFFCSIFEMAFL